MERGWDEKNVQSGHPQLRKRGCIPNSGAYTIYDGCFRQRVCCISHYRSYV